MVKGFVPTLVLIDDSEDDLLLSTISIMKAKLPCRVDSNRDGGATIDRLTQPNAELPSLVIVDYKMPDSDGIEIVRRLRGNERTQLVPVVIFSGTLEPESVRTSYLIGANSWVKKPTDPIEYGENVSALAHYWLKINRYQSSVSRQ